MNKNNPAKIYIERELEKQIQPFLKRKEVISIVGPRQAGKTTFILHLSEKLSKEGKKVKFLTFENRNDLAIFDQDIEDFRDLIGDHEVVVIDEFQYAKEGGQKLKYLYDTTEIKFIISGSSSLDLKFQTGKYMVGRMLEFKLMPFSFREFLNFADKELFSFIEKRVGSGLLDFEYKDDFSDAVKQKLNRQLSQFLIFGGYPAVALAKTQEEKEKILESILENYLLKDIKGLLNLATEDSLNKLSQFLATQIGNLINYQELSIVSGLSHHEIIKHLNVLEKTFIIGLIKPFFTNRRTELVKNPKCYFIDPGLRNYLMSDFRPLDTRSDVGALVENHIYSLLLKIKPTRDLKYWRTKSKAEVDFIIEQEQKIIPIEVKYSSQRTIGKSLYSFIEKFNPRIALLLTKNYFGQEKNKNTQIKFIPVSYF